MMSSFARTIMERTYSHPVEDENRLETWEEIAARVVRNVMKAVGVDMRQKLAQELYRLVVEKKFIPGGRYLYAAGNSFHMVNNCLCLGVYDSREGWSELLMKASMALMSGAGIGVNYSSVRHDGAPIRKTGGVATGPIALMQIVNECGRGIMQGGNRRSALWAGLNWSHPDIHKFIRIKNWSAEIQTLKAKDYSFPATLDFTNISVLLDDMFFEAYQDDEHPQHSLAHGVYWAVVEQMLKTGDPGLSVDIGKNGGEVYRNACTEVASRDTDDCCNLASINLSRVESLEEFKSIVDVAMAFLLAGSVYSDVPYSDVDKARSKNRRLGLGLMGIHEWLLRRGKSYGPDEELGIWLAAYAKSGRSANKWADAWSLSRPKKTRAIAPNGTTGLVAETTGGIEPIFCLTPETLVLQSNLDWKPIDSLLVGDTIIGFREEPLDFRSNKFQFGTITSKEEVIQPCYRITTDKGSVECSVNHLWVAREKLPVSGQTQRGQGWQWMTTHNLRDCLASGRSMKIAFTTQPWEKDNSFDGGWLSGMFDGEGFLGGVLPRRGLRMSICQNKGPTLDRVKRLLTEREVAFVQQLVGDRCYKLTPLGKWAALKILGLVKPSRLIGKIPELLVTLKLCGKYSPPATVLDIRYLGSRRVIALGTTTKTLIANGFLSHNCVAYKRRYLKGDQYYYQYVVDPCARRLIESGIDPGKVEDAYVLARDVEKRVAFQAWVQGYVDHCISSTINLPAYGSELNNQDMIRPFGSMLMRYLPQLRGITCYPDGSRSGQPLSPVPYDEALAHEGIELLEESMNVCNLRGGSCGD